MCPYCGTVSPAQLAADGTLVKEHDLALALRAIPDSARGWDRDRTPVQCQSCKAISLFESTRVAQRCEFCGSPAVVPYEDTRNVIYPESLLPFTVSEAQVRESIRRWYASRWFAPNRLKRAALTDRVGGVYLPYWTFDAQVHARWTAEAGHYYYETRMVTRNGRSETVREQRVRWVPAAGEISTAFDDELVAATQGIHPQLLRRIEPFPTSDPAPLRQGLRLGLGRRAVPDRPGRGGRAGPRGNGRQGAGGLRARGARRHLPQPGGGRHLQRPDLQAHAAAGVAAALRLRPAQLPGGGQRRHRARLPASSPTAGSRSSSPCWR